MKAILTRLLSGLLVVASVSALAVTRYVDLGSPNATPPYTNWTTAATTIQAAIDVALDGDLILVADGGYATGTNQINGASRIGIDKPVTVQSVNGPQATWITGRVSPSMRCAYVGNGGILSGFTLRNSRSTDGGGAYCSGGTLSNCVITGNTALRYGGGVAGGTLYDCIISGNSAPGFQNLKGRGGGLFSSVAYRCRISGNSTGWIGGGVSDSVLYNCLIDGNASVSSTELFVFGGGAALSTLVSCTIAGNHTGTLPDNGGGTYGCTVSNSIVYYNNPENDTGSSINFSCTSPQADGVGNFSSDPTFGADYQLSSNSPCINSGDNSMIDGNLDQLGNPRIVGGFIDVGALEFQAASFPNAYATANYTNLLVGFAASFNAGYNWGRATTATWDFGDSTIVTNTLTPTHAWSSAGDYSVVAQIYAPNNGAGLSATVNVHVATQIVYYVDAASTNPLPPYLSWQTAATNIQDAVDVATPAAGALVLVTNGVYRFGGRAVYGSLTNRVSITKPIAIQSVNGSEVTFIQGNQLAGSLYGEGAIRCVYLTNSASLTGFTITGGASQMLGDADKEQSGGGVWCESTNATLIDCQVIGNVARLGGGGVFRGNLIDCKLEGNRAVFNSGGGAKLARLKRCTLIENSAGLHGGGVDQSTLDACALLRNLAFSNGGGANDSTLKQCTLVANSAAAQGGGVATSALTDCVVYCNSAQFDPNYASSILSYCCATPLSGGLGNISSEPQLTDGIHIASNSPCLGVGSLGTGTTTDIDGETWLSPPSIGCDEFFSGIITSPLDVAIQVAYTNVAAGWTQDFVGVIAGRASYSVWNFGGERFTNQPSVTRAYTVDGSYPVELTAYNDSNPGGVSASVIVHVVTQPIHYVSLANTNPVPPYFSWETAATNLQDAVDVAFGASVVLVTNGIYQTGGRISSGSLTNRLVVDKRVTVQSVNGPEAATIRGNVSTGNSAVRCVALSQGSKLIGFTLTEGSTRNSGEVIHEQSGGGAWCQSTNEMIWDCVIVSNTAAQFGGAVYSGSLSNCVLNSNTAVTGGGAWAATLNFCTVVTNVANNGGGVASNILNDCIVIGNKANSAGGGAYGSWLNDCVIAWNTNLNAGGGGGGGTIFSVLNTSLIQSNSARTGGGIYGGTATNCTIASNLATGSSGGGGAYQALVNNSLINANLATTGPGGGGASSTFNNCLVSSNWSATTANGVYSCFVNNCTVVGHTNGYAVFNGASKNSIVYNNTANYSSGTFSNCCTAPLPPGYGNFTNNPLFAELTGGDFRLQSNSPCINAGNNRYVTNAVDLDRNARIQAGAVDVGAYEFQTPSSLLSYAWAMQFGLATDGSADYLDADSDAINNYVEWRSDTNPTNALSALRMLYATNSPTGARVAWQSVSTRSYWLERTTNLGAPALFKLIATNIAGVTGTKTFTDASATNAVQFFYRVGVY